MTCAFDGIVFIASGADQLSRHDGAEHASARSAASNMDATVRTIAARTIGKACHAVALKSPASARASMMLSSMLQ